jgi:hypothetical protein
MLHNSLTQQQQPPSLMAQSTSKPFAGMRAVGQQGLAALLLLALLGSPAVVRCGAEPQSHERALK